MDINYIDEFFSSYSLPSFVIAIIIAVICIVVDKLFLKKVSFNIRAYLPFLLGIAFYILYELIFKGNGKVFTKQVLTAGLVSGSLAGVIFAIIRKVLSGKGVKNVLSPLALLIESIIFPIVSENKLESAVKSIEKLLIETSDDATDEHVTGKIADELSRHSNENITEIEIITSAKLIVTGRSSLGKK